MSIIDYFLSIFFFYYLDFFKCLRCGTVWSAASGEKNFKYRWFYYVTQTFFCVVVLRRVDIQITWAQICHPHRPLERDLCILWPVDTQLGNCIGRNLLLLLFFFFFFPYSMQFRAIKDTTSGSPYNWNNSNHLLLSVALSLFKYNESQLLCITLCLSTLRGRKLGS